LRYIYAQLVVLALSVFTFHVCGALALFAFGFRFLAHFGLSFFIFLVAMTVVAVFAVVMSVRTLRILQIGNGHECDGKR